ncbi:hypothetical protein ACFW93_45585 [Streptomyces canus]|uniref:hypothetical protein n=1 Tax=Streptomyces canus TaxID=58343 RepID=UPI0036B6E641
MPLVVEIILIVIGILLLAAALIGSGISRRLMTIPKMKRAPRIGIAILGVLLLVGGMWGVTAEKEQHHGPTLAALRDHLPPRVQEMDCTESSESPKNAVELNCGTQGAFPDSVWYYMFDGVNSMQDWWHDQTSSVTRPGDDCSTLAAFKSGTSHTYSIEDESVTVGDQACYMDGNTLWDMYTDRRFNIIVLASIPDATNFSAFESWLNDGTSQPIGADDAAPATPSQTVNGD